MTAADLAKTRLYFAHCRFRGARALPNDNEDLARKFLRELGRNPEVTTPEQLEALGRGAVIRDQAGWVYENMGDLWYPTRSTKPRAPELPAEVYSYGDEEP